MTQKKLITLVTILICGMALGACKGKSDEPTPTPNNKLANIDKSRYLGLDASAEEQKYFAPIYIPKKEDFKSGKLDLFKSAVTPFGWIYEAEANDPEGKRLYRFVSPNKKDENGKEIAETSQFCMDFLAYNHSMPGAPIHIRMGLFRHFAMDYLVDPETFTEPKDLQVQKELLKIMEHYGFTEDGQFTVLSGDNAYVAYNTKFDPETPLRGVMFTEQEKDHPGYRLTFQISYGRR